MSRVPEPTNRIRTAGPSEKSAGGFFSGIAGLELGLQRAGWQIEWVSEIKPAACAVLERHFPGVPNIGDITRIENEWSAIPRVDLVCGGFPCQDLSHAHTNSINGARAGLDGQQSGLWRYFRDGIGALEPEWVIVENVDTWRSWVPTVRADLSRLGYASLPLELSAGSFGAPHRRPRHFVVAHAHGDSEPLLAIYEEVGKLRPIPRSDSGYWRDAPSRAVLLDDGVPARMGQNDLYGNAVVPQVAQWLGEQIAAQVEAATVAARAGGTPTMSKGESNE